MCLNIISGPHSNVSGISNLLLTEEVTAVKCHNILYKESMIHICNKTAS